MKLPRQCCRPGCSRVAVATLTFVYAESTAVIGPLATANEPHSWDLCEEHAHRITVPRGWEMLRSERGFSAPIAEDYELTALAEAVREGGAARARPRVGGRGIRDQAESDMGRAELDQELYEEIRGGRHRSTGPVGESQPTRRSGPVTPRPGRRGHLRVLPDPVD
ncbi:MAG: DUF3499 domain-containing protein [Gordonia sp. (in: high G+C Gram-positive bacteria)]